MPRSVQFAAGQAGPDLLRQPAVSVRVAERRVAEVGAPFRVGAGNEPGRRAVEYLADLAAETAVSMSPLLITAP